MTTPTGQPAETADLTAQQAEVAATAAAAAAAAASAALVYDLQQAALRAATVAALLTLWEAVGRGGGPLSPVAADKFVEQLLPVVTGAQRTMSALTVAQIRQDVREAGRRPAQTPVRTERYTTANLRGVDPLVVYRRPITTTRYALQRGIPLERAMQMGARRAESITASDLQLAKTHTARDVLQQEAQRGTVVGYRRVLSNRGQHCALCVLASTQRYTTDQLSPMHPGCGCSVRPIVGDHDPGQVINRQRAVDIHEAIARDLGRRYANASGKGYRDIVVVNEHGELGPVLGVRDHAFTGADHIPRLTHDRLPDAEETS